VTCGRLHGLGMWLEWGRQWMRREFWGGGGGGPLGKRNRRGGTDRTTLSWIFGKQVARMGSGWSRISIMTNGQLWYQMYWTFGLCYHTVSY
jgi:hypothetical protein